FPAPVAASRVAECPVPDEYPVVAAGQPARFQEPPGLPHSPCIRQDNRELQISVQRSLQDPSTTLATSLTTKLLPERYRHTINLRAHSGQTENGRTTGPVVLDNLCSVSTQLAVCEH